MKAAWIWFFGLGSFIVVLVVGVRMTAVVRAVAVRESQTNTVVIMESVGSAINRLPVSLEPREWRLKALAILHSTRAGKDAWGNEIAFFARASSGVREYVLVSPGSDGKFEFRDGSRYFSLVESIASYDSRQDLVVRNGIAITHAGK